MKTLNIKMYLITLLMSALVGCGGSQVDFIDTDPTPRVVAFGDSVTAGGIDKNGEKYGYAYRFSEQYGRRLVNRAVPGSSVEEDHQIGRIMRFPYRSDDVVIFLSGINNMRKDGLDPAALNTYESTLRVAVEKIHQSSSVLLLGTCPRLPYGGYAEGSYQNGSDAAADAYASVARKIASEFPGVILVDVNTDLNLSLSDYIDLGVHPGPSGSQILGDLFFHSI